MEFNLEQGIAVLERTPATLRAMLSGLPEDWVMNNEGGDSWSPYDVVGHLSELELTDWMPRIKSIMEHGTARDFEPVDPFVMLTASEGKSLAQLLDELTERRAQSLSTLRDMNLSDEDLSRLGKHPGLGEVSLRQLLSTWVVHDLNHIHQVAQTMAHQYKEAIGPWKEYFPIF